MAENFLPNDYARCDNEDCNKRFSCARFLDVLPMEIYSFCKFKAEGCDFYIEKHDVKPKNNKK